MAVSNRFNLELCMRYDIAGFPEGASGVWAFSDIRIGDYLSFLYGATVFNLYRVRDKEAVLEAKKLPPQWKPIVSRDNRERYFPFRLYLERKKGFQDSIAKEIYRSIAENLLRRGGYGKSYFQTDQFTLGGVERIEDSIAIPTEPLLLPVHKTFEPKFSSRSKGANVYPLREDILQASIRHWLAIGEKRQTFLRNLGLDTYSTENLEVVGERALSEGYVDITLQEAILRNPKQVIIEIKMGRATRKDYVQLAKYVREIGERCVAGIMIAKSHAKYSEPQVLNLHSMTYDLRPPITQAVTFDEIIGRLSLSYQQDLPRI